jgi:uncharacterized DUF497 family protein
MNETSEKYSWNPEKREQNIKERGLDMVALAPEIFANPEVVIKPDSRSNYGEERYLAYGVADGDRICLCFTPREDKLHLITIFRMHKKEWEEHYGKSS